MNAYGRKHYERKQAFIRAYVATGDATAAALEAGYAPTFARAMARFLLANPEIVIAVEHRKRTKRVQELEDKTE